MSGREETRGHCGLPCWVAAHKDHPPITYRNKTFIPRTTAARAALSSKPTPVLLGKALNLKLEET